MSSRYRSCHASGCATSPSTGRKSERNWSHPRKLHIRVDGPRRAALRGQRHADRRRGDIVLRAARRAGFRPVNTGEAVDRLRRGASATVSMAASRARVRFLGLVVHEPAEPACGASSYRTEFEHRRRKVSAVVPGAAFRCSVAASFLFGMHSPLPSCRVSSVIGADASRAVRGSHGLRQWIAVASMVFRFAIAFRRIGSLCRFRASAYRAALRQPIRLRARARLPPRRGRAGGRPGGYPSAQSALVRLCGCVAGRAGAPSLVVDFFGVWLVRVRRFSGAATGFGTCDPSRLLLFEVPQWIVHRVGLRGSDALASLRGGQGRAGFVAIAESPCRVGTAPGRFPRLCRFDPARRSRVTSPRPGSAFVEEACFDDCLRLGADGAS